MNTISEPGKKCLVCGGETVHGQPKDIEFRKAYWIDGGPPYPKLPFGQLLSGKIKHPLIFDLKGFRCKDCGRLDFYAEPTV